MIVRTYLTTFLINRKKAFLAETQKFFPYIAICARKQKNLKHCANYLPRDAWNSWNYIWNTLHTSMYAFLFKNFRNFSRHQKQHFRHLYKRQKRKRYRLKNCTTLSVNQLYDIFYELETPGADLASSARRGAFHGVVHEGALLPTLLWSLQRYYPNITTIWDGRMCMFAILLRFKLSCVY